MMKNNDKKFQLIKAASKRFSKLGYYKTTLEEVARDIRIGKATIYHYFNSKDELYFAVLEWEANDIIERIKSIFNDESIEISERFVNYFELKETILKENKIITNLLFRRIISELNESESSVIDKFLSDEIEVVNLFISFIYRKQVEKFDMIIPKEIVLISWVTALLKSNFTNSETEKVFFEKNRIKSILSIYLPDK